MYNVRCGGSGMLGVEEVVCTTLGVEEVVC